MAAPKIQVPFLLRTSWSSIFDVFGVVMFAYLGHSVLPSIVLNLENRKRIATVVCAGIALPCALYLLWSTVVLGAVPAISDSGGASLAEARTAGQPATVALGFLLGGSVILLGNVFAVLSTVTSYNGLGVSLKDSYADLARQRRRVIQDWALTALVVLPPLVVALRRPGAFVQTLDIAGTFGGGLFVGVLPVLIVIKLRRKEAPQRATTWGGDGLAWAVLVVYVAGMLYTAAKLAGST